MAAPPRVPPRWPTALLGACAILATLSLAQGIVDVVLPAVYGQPPFGFLAEASRAFGPTFFVAYVFVHNLGLACVVPGVGFLAIWFERRREHRRVIGLLLLGSVVASLLVAAEFLVQASERFDPRVALPILLGESVSILVVAWTAALELREVVPTPAYEWALVTPLRNLRWPLATSASLLALLAALETVVAWHTGWL